MLGYYLSSLFDFWGLEYVPVSLERLILFLNPTFVLLIGVFAFGRKVARREWIALAVSYSGVALVFVENLRVQGEHVLFGSALVLLAALSYALYLAMSGHLIKRIGSLRLVAYAMCVSDGGDRHSLPVVARSGATSGVACAGVLAGADQCRVLHVPAGDVHDGRGGSPRRGHGRADVGRRAGIAGVPRCVAAGRGGHADAAGRHRR